MRLRLRFVNRNLAGGGKKLEAGYSSLAASA